MGKIAGGTWGFCCSCWDVSLRSVGSRHSATLSSRGLSSTTLSSPLRCSFLLPQDDVNEAADEAEGERHPGHHVGVAIIRAIVRTHHRVDDGGAHHEHAYKEGRKEGKKDGRKARDEAMMILVTMWSGA